MTVHEDLADTIGNTPLIRLRQASEATGCEIFGKCEFLNPGGSIKDRAAKFIILDAEARGALHLGGTIVEGTAGNTGIGLALVAASRGYRTVIVIPETQSDEKKDMLRLAGAELVQVPAAPYRNPNNYVRIAERLAAQLDKTSSEGVVYANQWDNLANMRAHYEGTGPEIWNQLDGKIDGFVCAIGTGGTLAGISRYLKEKNSAIQIGLADPDGAAMFDYFTSGELKSEGSSITEGIGQGRVTDNVAEIEVDHPFRISDTEALPVLFDLLRLEGLCLGGSSGVNLAGAIRLAKKLGPGHTIVTVLCDPGQRYQSKLWNPAFLREKGLPVPAWLDNKKSNISVPYE